MILHTESVEPKPGYRLQLKFNNGASGEVDLTNELWGEMFEPLKDPDLFATAQQDDAMGTVVWANGVDLAPEFLFDLLNRQRRSAA